MSDPDCIFCKIVAGELPAEKVDEDEHTISFMDINPWTRGHALVIPKQPPKNLYEVDPRGPGAHGRAPPSGWRCAPATRWAPTA